MTTLPLFWSLSCVACDPACACCVPSLLPQRMSAASLAPQSTMLCVALGVSWAAASHTQQWCPSTLSSAVCRFVWKLKLTVMSSQHLLHPLNHPVYDWLYASVGGILRHFKHSTVNHLTWLLIPDTNSDTWLLSDTESRSDTSAVLLWMKMFFPQWWMYY